MNMNYPLIREHLKITNKKDHVLQVAYPEGSDYASKDAVVVVYCERKGNPFVVYYPAPEGHRVRYFWILSDAVAFAYRAVTKLTNGETA
jgi:hypothetical protein